MREPPPILPQGGSYRWSDPRRGEWLGLPYVNPSPNRIVLDLVLTCDKVTAVFHRLAPHATVVGIDHLQSLVDLSKSNLRKDGVKLGAFEGGVEMVCGDGRLGAFTH